MNTTSTPIDINIDDTAEAAVTVPRGYWKNAEGCLIPLAKIKEIDKERHHLVNRLAEDAKKLQERLAEFKLTVMGDIEGFVHESAAKYEARVGGDKGNVTLVSFDGRYKITRQVQERLAFDERLQVAKELIDQCVHVWSKGANKNIQALVAHAFQVDKEGKVSTGRVLALRKLQIDDPQWLKAMAAIADSMKTVASKAYVRFYERDDKSGEYVPISLDLAAL